jgi:hypothetical protein
MGRAAAEADTQFNVFDASASKKQLLNFRADYLEGA